MLSLTCSLLATPISWLHYFALLVIPLAIVRPRLSPLWLLPLVLQFPTVGPDTVQTIIMFALVATISALAVVPEGRTRADPPSSQLGKPEPSGGSRAASVFG